MNDGPLNPLCDNCSTNGEPLFCWLSLGDDGGPDASDSVRRCPRGAVLFGEGQTPRGVYVLCEGRVKLSTCSFGGRVLITDIAGPGHVLGLSAVVSGGAHEVSGETLTVRDRTALEALALASPSVINLKLKTEN